MLTYDYLTINLESFIQRNTKKEIMNDRRLFIYIVIYFAFVIYLFF